VLLEAVSVFVLTSVFVVVFSGFLVSVATAPVRPIAIV